MPRTNFTDQQRAEIFALDCATCTYSGRSLWIADYGIDPLYQVDWADHIVPASRGGPSTVDNGAAAAWHYNYLRGNERQRLALYSRGLPTAEHTTVIGSLDPVIAAQLERFTALEPSDWFLNRAMWHLSLAVSYEYQRKHGAKRSRDYAYYSGCAWTSLQKWRRACDIAAVPPLEERGLTLDVTEPDQAALLRIRDAQSATQLVSMMHELWPAYEAAADGIYGLGEAGTEADVASISEAVTASALIPQRIRSRLISYCAQLRRLFHLNGF